MDNYNKYCIVCGQYSQGKPQCIDCWTASQNYSSNISNTHVYNLKWESLEYLFNQTVKKIKKQKNQNTEITQSLCNQLIGIGFFENDYYCDANSELLKRAYDIISEVIVKDKTIEQNKDDEKCEEILDYRKKFPTNIHCIDGHYVRSRDERTIDDYLYNIAKLLHAYEPKFRLTDKEKELCKKAGFNYDCFYPDFYIPEYNLYIEYFGKDDEKYVIKTDLKIKIYQNRKGINFRYLTYKDSNILIEKLEDILNEFK